MQRWLHSMLQAHLQTPHRALSLLSTPQQRSVLCVLLALLRVVEFTMAALQQASWMSEQIMPCSLQQHTDWWRLWL